MARLSFTREERDEILRKRQTLRASWQALARMHGANEHDFRVACDPDYARRALGGGVAATEPESIKETITTRTMLGRVLLRLAAGETLNANLAEHLGRDRSYTNNVLQKLKTRGLVVCARADGQGLARNWTLTPAGSALAATLSAELAAGAGA